MVCGVIEETGDVQQPYVNVQDTFCKLMGALPLPWVFSRIILSFTLVYSYLIVHYGQKVAFMPPEHAKQVSVFSIGDI